MQLSLPLGIILLLYESQHIHYGQVILKLEIAHNMMNRNPFEPLFRPWIHFFDMPLLIQKENGGWRRFEKKMKELAVIRHDIIFANQMTEGNSPYQVSYKK